MRSLPRPREYLAEHGYDTVLLLFLLGADLTWLLLVEVNFPFTVCAVLWSLFIACYDNPGKPNELVVRICVAGWVLGHALWTMCDFAEDGKRVMGGGAHSEQARTIVSCISYLAASRRNRSPFSPARVPAFDLPTRAHRSALRYALARGWFADPLAGLRG